MFKATWYEMEVTEGGIIELGESWWCEAGGVEREATMWAFTGCD